MPAAKSAQKKVDQTVVDVSDSKKQKAQKEVEKKEVKKPVKKEVKKQAEPVPPQPVKEVENVVVVSDEQTLNDNFTEFITKFQAMISNFSSLKSELKTLEKRTMKQLKVVQKINNKKKKKGTRAPSGFVKPAPISEELAQFLGKPKGTEMARTDVTREINKYIRAHDLQDKENGRKIIPDKALSALLKIDNEVQLTYFNLQRYMGPHFPKQTKVEVSQ